MARLLDRYRGLICDLDGVVYRGALAVPHAVETLRACAGLTRQVFATNNASRSPAMVAAHLASLGLPVGPAQVVTSAEAGAARLAGQLLPGDLVLAVGGTGVFEALSAVGLRPVRSATGVRAVLQGYGPEVTAADLAEASYAIEGGAAWVATNADATLPTDRGIAPGNGMLVEAVAVATGRRPVLTGKPQTPLYELSVARLGVERDQVLVVGDRLDTDILGAMAAGLDSLWVLTGVDGLESWARSAQRVVPTQVSLDLTALERPVPRVAPEGGWWLCGGVRVRVDLLGPEGDLVHVAWHDRGPGSGRAVDALLAAGFRALTQLRDQPSADVDRLAEAALELTRLVTERRSTDSGH